MRERNEPQLWGEDRVALYRAVAQEMHGEGKEALVLAERHEGTPYFRMIISGTHSFELQRRVALRLEAMK